jgi:hypothetical protein
MLVGLPTAHAADTTLTLACQGTTTDTAKEDSKPEPFSMGIIVNFTTRIVTGFTFPGATLPVTITKFDDVHILFGGSSKSWTISGSIDRVTGDTAATSQMSTATGEITSSIEYALKCRPAQRMF